MLPRQATIEILRANQGVTSSIVPVTVGAAQVGNEFQFLVQATRRLFWRFTGVLTLGATGGFRFLAHCTAAPAFYNALFHVEQDTTPAQFFTTQLAEAAFANAAAVAEDYSVVASGSVIAGAVDTTFAFQFAQNTSDVLTATMNAGAVFECYYF